MELELARFFPDGSLEVVVPFFLPLLVDNYFLPYLEL
jgi:hypothetical protein